MKKRGFTLVELLGVIVILVIVLGLAVVSYVNIRNSIRNTYYNGVEESILLSVGDYYTYNESAIPEVFGDVKKVYLQELVDKKYIEEVLDQNNKKCNHDKSYVLAYKDSYDKTNYVVCLECDKDGYQTKNSECSEEFNYGINLTATIGNTSTLYKSGEYTNDNVFLHFKTMSDIETIIVVDELGNDAGRCNVKTENGVSGCNVQISKSGIFSAYGTSNGKQTKEERISILIDKTSPTFDIYSGDDKITGNQTVDTVDTYLLNLNVINIHDTGSGIKRIRYSLENKNDKEKYIGIDKDKETFPIEKALTPGVYKLIVEVVDNAGNTTKKEIEFVVARLIPKPTADTACNKLTYTGSELTLTKNISGIEFLDNKKTDAKDYIVTARLEDENNMWSDRTRDEVKFTCSIERQKSAEIGTCNIVTYDGTKQTLTNGGVNVSYLDNEKTDAGSYPITVLSGSNYAFTDGEISKTIDCSIGKRDLTITPKSNQSKKYGEIDPAFTYQFSGVVSGEEPKFEGGLSREVGEDVGNYKILAGDLSIIDNDKFKKDNYNLVFSTTTINFTIKNREVSTLDSTLDKTTYVYTGEENKPGVVVKDGDKVLTPGIDYTIEYKNNTDVGEGIVTITGIGNYEGTSDETFTITKADDEVTLSPKTATYTGSKIEANTATAKSGSNIKYEYYKTTNCTGEKLTDAPINAGNYSVKAISDGNKNYNSGSTCAPHTINKKSGNDFGVTLDNTTFTYTGEENKPGVVVKDGDKVLTPGIDYTIEYKNNTDVGEGIVTITGIGNYEGTSDETFTITKADDEVTLSPKTATYTGSKIEANTATAKSGSNIKYEYYKTTNCTGEKLTDAPINAGNYSVKAISDGNKNYNSGSTCALHTINKKSGNDFGVTLDNTTFTYTGEENKPGVVVKDGDKVLTPGVDYTVDYINNINASRTGSVPTVVITFIGNYEGETTETFIIEKSTPTLTISPESGEVDANSKITFTEKASVPGSFKNISNNSDIALINSGSEHKNISANALRSVEITGVSNGNTTITINFTPTDTDNYNPTSSSYSINVSKVDVSTLSIVLDKTSYIYDGTEKKPVITVKDGATTLTLGTNYTLSYENNINVGEATVTINGLGKYSGSTTRTFTIDKSLPNVALNPENGSVTYNETSTFTVTPTSTPGVDGKWTVVSNDPTHVEIISGNNSNAINNIGSTITYKGIAASTSSSTITVTFTPTDTANYNSKSVTYTVNSVTKANNPTVVSPKSGLIYNNSNQELVEVSNVSGTIYYSTSKLTSTNYTSGSTEVPTGINKGDYVIYYYIVGGDNYKDKDGSIQTTIAPKNPTLTIELSDSTYTYDGSAKTPSVTVKDGTTTLVKDTDYTVSYSNNINANTSSSIPTVTITLKGNYTGSGNKTFTIEKANVNLTITPTSGSVNQGSTVTFKEKSNILGSFSNTSGNTSVAVIKSGASYNNVSANTEKTVTIEGKSNGESIVTITFTPSDSSNYNVASATYKVTGYKTASNLRVELSQTEYTYDGNAKTPSVSVYENSTKLTLGTHYTVEYRDNTKAGTAKVIVTGKGEYAGEIIAEFTINKANPLITLTPESGDVVQNSSISFQEKASILGSFSNTSLTTSVATISSGASYNNVSANTNKIVSLNTLNAGTSKIKVEFTPSDTENYNSVSKEYNLTVLTSVAIPSTSYCKTNLSYTGSLLTLTTDAPSGFSFSNNTGVDVGSYTVTASLNSGYRWSDNSTSNKTFECSIEKSDPVVTLSETNLVVSQGEEAFITEESSAKGTFTYLSNNNSVISLIYDDENELNANTEKTFSIFGDNEGSAIVTVTFTPTDTKNYNAITKTISVEVRKRYCATFYKNGAEEVNHSSEISTNICCDVTSGTSCNIQFPEITPITGYDVIGWDDTETSKTKKYDVGDTLTLTDSTKAFYAVTRSKSSTRKQYNIEFKLNGADSYNYLNTTYTIDKSFTCYTTYGYNGEDIPDYCIVNLPTITRSGTDAKVYGWSTNEYDHGSDVKTAGASTKIYESQTLHAITSRKITLSYDSNIPYDAQKGVDTLTSKSESKEVFNNNGTIFNIPEYGDGEGQAKICRTRGGDLYHGYGLAGLNSDPTSTNVQYCFGDQIYLEEDLTLSPVWGNAYAVGHANVDLNIRQNAGTGYASYGIIPNGGTVYIKSSNYWCDGSYPWYAIIYGNYDGYAARAANCSNGKAYFTVDWEAAEDSCVWGFGCQSNSKLLSITPSDLELNITSNPTYQKLSEDLSISNQCGNITNVRVADPSIVSVSLNGNVYRIQAISGSVSEFSSKTTTITFETAYGCSENVNVTVKNVDLSPPTVSITATGTTEGDGFRTGAVATITCNSPTGIKAFIVNGTLITEQTGTLNAEGTQFTTQITLTTPGSSEYVAGYCLANNDQESYVVNYYKIYTYGQSSACSCAKYNSCSSCSACGGSTSTTYGSWSRVECTPTLKTSTSTIQWSCEKDPEAAVCSSTKYYMCKSRSIKTTSYCKTCENSNCTCKTRNSCWHT